MNPIQTNQVSFKSEKSLDGATLNLTNAVTRLGKPVHAIESQIAEAKTSEVLLAKKMETDRLTENVLRGKPFDPRGAYNKDVLAQKVMEISKFKQDTTARALTNAGKATSNALSALTLESKTKLQPIQLQVDEAKLMVEGTQAGQALLATQKYGQAGANATAMQPVLDNLKTKSSINVDTSRIALNTIRGQSNVNESEAKVLKLNAQTNLLNSKGAATASKVASDKELTDRYLNLGSEKVDSPLTSDEVRKNIDRAAKPITESRNIQIAALTDSENILNKEKKELEDKLTNKTFFGNVVDGYNTGSVLTALSVDTSVADKANSSRLNEVLKQISAINKSKTAIDKEFTANMDKITTSAVKTKKVSLTAKEKAKILRDEGYSPTDVFDTVNRVAAAENKAINNALGTKTKVLNFESAKETKKVLTANAKAKEVRGNKARAANMKRVTNNITNLLYNVSDGDIKESESLEIRKSLLDKVGAKNLGKASNPKKFKELLAITYGSDDYEVIIESIYRDKLSGGR